MAFGRFDLRCLIFGVDVIDPPLDGRMFARLGYLGDLGDYWGQMTPSIFCTHVRVDGASVRRDRQVL